MWTAKEHGAHAAWKFFVPREAELWHTFRMLALLLSLALAADPPLFSIDLQNADIHTVLRFIADYAHLNLVVDDRVQGTVTVRLKNVTWQDALSAVLASKGLAAVVSGNTLLINPPAP